MRLSASLGSWPERWRNPPVEDVMRVYFSAVSESEREVRILAVGERAEGVLMKL